MGLAHGAAFRVHSLLPMQSSGKNILFAAQANVFCRSTIEVHRFLALLCHANGMMKSIFQAFVHG